MKAILLLLLLSILSSCDDSQNYHGIIYNSSCDTKTLTLVGFEDNQTTSGTFLICIGSFEEETKYRFLVEFPDKTIKMITCSPYNIFIKYSDKCTITTSMSAFIYNSWHDDVIIEVPKEFIKYENIIDGK